MQRGLAQNDRTSRPQAGNDGRILRGWGRIFHQPRMACRRTAGHIDDVFDTDCNPVQRTTPVASGGLSGKGGRFGAGGWPEHLYKCPQTWVQLRDGAQLLL